MSARRPLPGGWSVRAVGGPAEAAERPVPATVPGCVHTDLLSAGLIPDPYLDDNEVRLQWIGRSDWEYETEIDWSDDGAARVDLVCAGLDTVASVSLNGVEVGQTANMHRRYRFGMRELLQPGKNRLAVRFTSPLRYAEELDKALGERPYSYDHPFNMIRKMACNFGWDWGPTLVTSGIWRPIGLHSWSTARIADVRPLATMDGRVEVHVSLERTDDAPVTVTASIAGTQERVSLGAAENQALLRLTVDDPAPWWPRGYGAQARYPLEVSVADRDGTALDTWRRAIGFRSVRIDTAPDEHGSPFTLVVNDVPVFVRGVNWIPDDCFPSRVTRERYASRLGQAAAANVNYLRVWGGGIYESDDFYDVADELGLLVGQDFLFACAAYPEEEPIASEVAAEARDNVNRLASHPSLALWTGNNECLWGHADWGWKERLGDRSWGAGYYFDLLPRILAELDGNRPYWPGSPYSGAPERHPNEPAHGTTHLWEVWNARDYTHYRDSVPRFVAEFGFQGPPAYATLRRAVSDEPLRADSPGVAHHQKAPDGAGKLARGMAHHLPEPRDFDDWHWLTQLNQARAVTFGIEHLRSHRGRCMGSIVWQLNDCWPVTSWAAVDGDGRQKPLWYALRRAYANRLLTIQPRDGGLALVAANETGEPWSVSATVRRLGLDGRQLASAPALIDVPARSAASRPLPLTLSTPDDALGEVLVADADGDRALWFFAEDRDLAYPPAAYTAEVQRVPHGARVSVTARTILRDLCLFPDRLDPRASVDDALVTVLPGERATFDVRTDAELPVAALTSRPVLRCANDRVGDAG